MWKDSVYNVIVSIELSSREQIWDVPLIGFSSILAGYWENYNDNGKMVLEGFWISKNKIFPWVRPNL